MSLSDFRQLVDIRGGHFIGIECTDGATIHIGIDGEASMTATVETLIRTIVPRLRDRMQENMRDGFNKFHFGFGEHYIELNYYDAGQLLDALMAAVRMLG